MVTGFSGEYFQNPGQYTSNIHRISPEKGNVSRNIVSTFHLR